MGAIGAGEACGVFVKRARFATFGLAQDQRVNSRYASFLKYFEALAAPRMERMPDLRPS